MKNMVKEKMEPSMGPSMMHHDDFISQHEDGGHKHHSKMYSQHGAGHQLESDKVKALCGGGMSYGKKK